MYNPSPYSPRQEVTTPDAVSNPRCLRARGFTTALLDTRYPASGKILKQHRVAARNRKPRSLKGSESPVRERRRGAASAYARSQSPDTAEDRRPPLNAQVPFVHAVS